MTVRGMWDSGETQGPSVKASAARSSRTLTAGLRRRVPDRDPDRDPERDPDPDPDPVPDRDPDPVQKTTRPRSLKDLRSASLQKKPATPTLGPKQKPVGRRARGGVRGVDTVRAHVSVGIQKMAHSVSLLTGGQRGLGRVRDPVAWLVTGKPRC